eukprot:GHVS01055585.1.p4 GENE.GHVS01055585.1~~GHVS01055585.1.p4  ORF type:complete len:112 (+),score=35.55 GHVS01055585.1:252-587(+)
MLAYETSHVNECGAASGNMAGLASGRTSSSSTPPYYTCAGGGGGGGGGSPSPLHRQMSAGTLLLSHGSWPATSGVRHQMVSAVMSVCAVPPLHVLCPLLQTCLVDQFRNFR